MEMGRAMESARFTVPALDQSREALDLSNILNSIKGVASVAVNLDAHTVLVEYDGGYTDHHVLHEAIRQSGYPLDGCADTAG